MMQMLQCGAPKRFELVIIPSNYGYLPTINPSYCSHKLLNQLSYLGGPTLYGLV